MKEHSFLCLKWLSQLHKAYLLCLDELAGLLHLLVFLLHVLVRRRIVARPSIALRVERQAQGRLKHATSFV